MTHANTYSAALEPVDPILFGDSRSARAGLDHLQLDQDPSPLTLHAAVAKFIWDASRSPQFPSALGDQVDDILQPGTASVAELLGFAYREAGGALWFPKPLHFRCSREVRKGERPRFFSHDLLSPSERLDNSTSSCPLERVLLGPALAQEAQEPLLIAEARLAQVLTGSIRQESLDGSARPLSDVFLPEMRPGIVIQNATGRTEEGMFFSRPYRRFGPATVEYQGSALGWGFAGWMATPGALTHLGPNLGFLGGDRRRVRIQLEALSSRGDVLASLREGVLQHAGRSRGFLLYLLTPRIVDAVTPWPAVNGVRPIAAATGKPQFVSGWNTKLHQPRPLVALEPAGSVYFFRWPDGAGEEGRKRVVEEQWLSAVGSGGAAGFGRVLVGVWK